MDTTMATQLKEEKCFLRKTTESINKYINDKSLSYEQSLNPTYKRNTGSYYTGFDLAKNMIDELFNAFSQAFIVDLENKTFLEPCVGSGNFVFAYLLKVKELGLSQEKAKKIIHNIYVCDSNPDAIKLYKELLNYLVFCLWDIKLDETYHLNNTFNTGLLYDVTKKDRNEYISFNQVFKNTSGNLGFDIIVTNPPYKNLKAEKNKYLTTEHIDREKKKYLSISKDVKKNFIYANEGVINLYKLFIEKILTTFSKQHSYISLLVSSTILTDKTCGKLRSYILENHNLSHISVIQEKNNYIKAQQSLCTLLITKSEKTEIIKITPNLCKAPKISTFLKIEDVLNHDTNNSIFSITPMEYEKLKQLRKYPNIKNLSFIKNLRGELDLTINSSFITNDKRENVLLRGKNIGFYTLNSTPTEYVDPKFINLTKKSEYIKQPRIACQQIVNIHKKRRVSFSYIDENCVLANSCNFIYVEPNKYNIDLFCLLGLLNSSIINWFFKLTSSNNHINNYEIDLFPIPVKSPYLLELGRITKEYYFTKNKDLLEKIDNLSNYCYDLQKEQISQYHEQNNTDAVREIQSIASIITVNDIENLLEEKLSIDEILQQKCLYLSNLDKKTLKQLIFKYKKITRNEILNHTTFKLSDLDIEIIKSVPEGGNWKNIPYQTLVKSKRLKRISETGGRTTLYGRIAYDKPVYTVTTYFNRPGNGTYVHPKHDRVISVREAARFQSFPDNYYFYGSKKDILNQVGNAVPPVLAYGFGKNIFEKTPYRNTLDLFCGAGGMTYGLKKAGLHTILCTDIDESACVTLKTNNPQTKVLCADITKEETKNSIVEIALYNNVEIICGGPPCQGFSHAGKRFVDDPRNALFKHFIDIVSKVLPKIIILENVEGMLTFKRGEIYKQIFQLFTELGYNTEGRILMANHYHIPQKRKRVFIVCVRDNLDFFPNTLFPTKTTEDPLEQINAFDAISDLEDINCLENAKNDYKAKILSNYIKEMRGIIEFGESYKLKTNETKPIQQSLF